MLTPLAAALFALVALVPSVEAHPVSGHVPFSVVLCDFADQPAPNPSAEAARAFLLDPATPNSVAAYWRDVSYGRIDFGGSVVVGPYRMTMSYAQWQGGAAVRSAVVSSCLDAAARDAARPYVPPPGNHVVAFVNACKDSGAVGTNVVLDPCAFVTTFTAHEFGHALGLASHSFSNDLTFRLPDAQPAEYDDEWDVMSAMHVFRRPVPSYKDVPPGLNAPYLDLMGWIPKNRIFRAGADGRSTVSIRLAALSTPSSPGFLMARVPFDPNDRNHYYVVELRAPAGIDAGIPEARVLIHEVRGGISYLLRAPAPDRAPVQTVNQNGVLIRVNSIDAAAGTAVVTITDGLVSSCVAGCANPPAQVWGPNLCKSGYVWRAADASDYVCVPSATRAATLTENRQAASRRGAGDVCLSPYVWREAYATDHVCVTTVSRSRAQQDDAQAGRRVATP